MAENSMAEIGPVVLVGAGKMGLAMARGWISGGLAPERLVLVDPKPGDATIRFAQSAGVSLIDSPLGILTHVMVLAVKPQVMSQVLNQIAPAVGRQTLVISIAAGISLAALSTGLNTQRVIRAMPNTPAQVGKGITGAVGLSISREDMELGSKLLASAGQLIWFDQESKLDAVTAVSGSGPAYVFHLVETMALAGMRQGLDAEQAMLLARQTVIGAAALMEADGLPAATLRENVTSPNGTTAAALKVLMAPDRGLEALMDRAIEAARLRSEELGHPGG
ncbi:MAG: pyrroline-5-carboxylate reductase [Devosia sp.]